MATTEFLRLTSLSWSTYFHLLNLRFITVQSCVRFVDMLATQEAIYMDNMETLRRQGVQIQTIQAHIDVESMRLRDLNNMTRMRRRELGLPAKPNPPEEVHDSGSESE